MTGDRRYKVLERYFKESDVKEEDEYIIDRFASLGYVNLGFYRNKDGKLVETAKLTPLGRHLYYEERRKRSFIRRFFYYLLPI